MSKLESATAGGMSPAVSSDAKPAASNDANDFSAATYSAEADCTGATSDVLLHIYQCDSVTGWLNRWWLKYKEIPIYHLGVEVYGEEWSFLYFEDSWDDESVSGVIRCQPKCMADYQYQESINLGPTPLSEQEVDQVLLRLHYEYPACTYHLTRRNCLTFAHGLVENLRPPNPFPINLKGIVDAASQAPRLDATVDYGWSWAKWYMIRKHQQPSLDGGTQSGYFCCTANGADRQSSMWSLLLQPSYSCSGKFCPAGPKGKVEGIDDYVVQGPIVPQDDAGSSIAAGTKQSLNISESVPIQRISDADQVVNTG